MAASSDGRVERNRSRYRACDGQVEQWIAERSHADGTCGPEPRSCAYRAWARVMIEKFAGVRGMVLSEFLDLNHTSKLMILVSLMIAKFARDAGCEVRRTSESAH